MATVDDEVVVNAASILTAAVVSKTKLTNPTEIQQMSIEVFEDTYVRVRDILQAYADERQKERETTRPKMPKPRSS